MDVNALNELIEPIADEMGFELVDIEYLSQYGRWILRIYLDKVGGITLDDCARASREIGAIIDVKDIFHRKYVLEVSSPGLNRPLRKEEDFINAIGKKVKIKLDTPLNGRRNFTGYLQRFSGGTLYIELEDDLVPIPLKYIKKANLEYEFE